VRYTSIKTIISIEEDMGWCINQMDVKTTFLNGFIEEEVYIYKPQGFEVSAKENHMCLLRKALYGLKQASQSWYSHIDTYFV
jgi:hypothetical protein